MPSAYEKQKAANIERNRQLLASLELDSATTDLFKNKPQKPKPAPKPKPKKAAPKKRKEPPAGGDEGPDTKAQCVEAPADPEAGGVRRSARNAGKSVDYKAEQNKSIKTIISFDHGRKSKNSGELGKDNGEPKYPKRYGAIPGVEVGTWWQGRTGCRADSIHAPLVAGISGNAEDGAYSIALSGGYEDDVDLGEAFTYTGSGGRDLRGTKDKPKNLRTAPQSSDQTFDNHFNAALKRSCDNKRPVRVIRGFKLHSPFAPAEGYRYDGLYIVEKAWREKGLNAHGFLVCKFALKRMPGQPPLPVRSDDDESDSEDEEHSDGVADAEKENEAVDEDEEENTDSA